MVRKIDRRILIAAGAILLVALLVVGNLIRGSQKVGVQVAKAKKGTIVSTVSAPGNIKAETEVKISAYVMGRITHLPVKEGDHVKKGQVLVQIDPAAYLAQVKQARASLELAQANLAQSEILYKRNQELFQKGLLSQEAFEQVATQHRLDLARVSQAQAALDQAQDTYRKTTITSPIDGTVVQLNVELGEVVVTGTMNNPGSVIMTVADMSQMEVEAQVDESEVKDIAVGQPAEIQVDALPSQKFSGVVSQVGNAAVSTSSLSSAGSAASVNYLVRVRINEKSDLLRSGMSANVEITTANKKDILVVPIQSVVMRRAEAEKREAEMKKGGKGARPRAALADTGAGDQGDGSGRRRREKEQEVVYVVESGRAAIVPVTIGVSDQDNIEIISGLKEGQQVIKGPFRVLRNIKHGDRIKVVKDQVKKGNFKGRRED